MTDQDRLMAACGLDCTECDMRMAAGNVKLAMDIADWFKSERNEDVPVEKIRCDWCKGERGKHWSDDCWILKCCVDDKGHGFCYECSEFPCDRLEEWANGSERYTQALQWLKGRKAGMG